MIKKYDYSLLFEHMIVKYRNRSGFKILWHYTFIRVKRISKILQSYFNFKNREICPFFLTLMTEPSGQTKEGSINKYVSFFFLPVRADTEKSSRALKKKDGIFGERRK